MKTDNKRSRKPLWITLSAVAACAAIAVGATVGTNYFSKDTPFAVSPDIKGMTLAAAQYPTLSKPDYDKVSDDEWEKVYTAYRKAKEELEVNVVYAQDISSEYYDKMLRTFLAESNGENAVFSPVNAFMALAMLAETTDGESRQQILNLLGAEDIEQLRKTANGLWTGCYSNDDMNKALLANSMWLSNAENYNQNTLQSIADNYYACSYSGEMGSKKFNNLLQSWLNENTGNLLKNQTADVEFTPLTVFAIVSTVYYKAQWVDEFSKNNNTEGYFTAANGSEQQTEFMNFHDIMYSYCNGDGYLATYVNIENGDKMWFILPDEGITPEQLINEGKVSEFLNEGKDELLGCEINFSMPKFDITSQLDFIEGMKQLGVTDIFDAETADFSPLCDNSDDIYLNQVDNAVRIAVDEKGVSAASYIVMMYCGSGAPEENPLINFTLDRPFVFVIENNNDMPLFCGIVNTLN